jgi:hypothetical protein
MGIAYRGAGKARQLVIGLNKVQGPNMTEPVAGIYRFVHVLGLGGRFSFVGPGDFVAPDAEGKIRPGKDGTMEMGRAVLAWKKAVGARTVLEACGGSVGQGKCVRLVQCWKPDDSVAFEDVAGNGGIAWDKVQCPEMPFAIDEPPAETDGNVPGSGDPDTGAPVIEAPIAIPEE